MGGVHLPEILVFGNILEVRKEIKTLLAITTHRKYNGWPAYQEDEEWSYHAFPDDRVCPVCKEYHYITTFSGPDISHNFPDNFPLDPSDTMKRQRAAEVHVTNPDLRGDCRCIIRWQDPVNTLAERLHREMEDAL